MVAYRRYPRGAFIISHSDPARCMYLLVSGRVKVSLSSPDGKELALDHLEAPAHFGESALVPSGPMPADVIATTDVEVFSLDARDFSAAVRIQPKLALSLIATLSKRLREMTVRLEDLAFNDATRRVMRVLLNIATATYETEGVPIVRRMTHYDIATLAGTSRETASRVISSLAKEGIVGMKGRTIVVDLIALRDGIGCD